MKIHLRAHSYQYNKKSVCEVHLNWRSQIEQKLIFTKDEAVIDSILIRNKEIFLFLINVNLLISKVKAVYTFLFYL